MVERRRLIVASVVLGCGIAALTSGKARAATPWGGDDTGYIPATSARLKCVSGFSKNATKYSGAVIGCHIKQAAALLANKPVDEEACEGAALTKAQAANAKLTGCPVCLNQAAVMATALTQLDSAANAAFFCAGSTPIGGDDAGKVPPDSASFKCEAAIAKGVGKLSAAIVACHGKYGAAKFANKAFDEEACEAAAITKTTAGFNKLVAKGGCPVGTTALLPTFGPQTELQIDSLNGNTWCSPSGAFID